MALFINLNLVYMNRDKFRISFLSISLITILTVTGYSQDVSGSKWNPGFDLVSSYLWRGSVYGRGPAIQPQLELSVGRLTAGAWGSFDFNGFTETDIYLLWSITSLLEAGITDYYYPDLSYFDYSSESGSHAFELNFYCYPGNFSFQAHYVLNRAGGAGSLGGDKYFEAGYGFKSVSFFAGAGDGWHTFDPETGNGSFKICNIGIQAIKTINLTDNFNLPLMVQLIFNPDQERLFVVAGISF